MSPSGPGNPTGDLDDVVHQRHLLGILAVAAEADRVEFGYLKDTLELTAGNLSRHLTVLENAKLVDLKQDYAGRRSRTWVRITSTGRQALALEIATLEAIVKRHTNLPK